MPISPLPLQVDDEGVRKGFATEMDFVGAGVSVAMSGAALTKATVTIGGGSGVAKESHVPLMELALEMAF